jgi:hypothetical protein
MRLFSGECQRFGSVSTPWPRRGGLPTPARKFPLRGMDNDRTIILANPNGSHLRVFSLTDGFVVDSCRGWVNAELVGKLPDLFLLGSGKPREGGQEII